MKCSISFMTVGKVSAPMYANRLDRRVKRLTCRILQFSIGKMNLLPKLSFRVTG